MPGTGSPVRFEVGVADSEVTVSGAGEQGSANGPPAEREGVTLPGMGLREVEW